ncbi:reverse transcriptase domain-containing protein [Tanacetum coccineum]
MELVSDFSNINNQPCKTSGQVENTNRALKIILEKTVKDNPAIWSRKLDDILWAFRTAYKTPTGTTPYKLIYGKNCHSPFEIKHRAYWALKNCNPGLIAAGEKQMFQLHKLDELRHQAYENSHLYKARTKVWHDRKLRMRKEFKHGNKGFDEEEVWEVIEEWLIAPVTPPPMPVVPPPSVYKVESPSTAAAKGQSFPLLVPRLPVPPSVIEDLSTRLGTLEYEHGQLVKKVIQVSDAEVAAGITIGEISPRISAVEGQVQVMASQMVYAADRFEQIGTQVEQGQQTVTQRDEVITGLTQQVQALQAVVHQRDSQIQQLQTTVSEISSRESTLMQCILGMYRRLADLERRPLGPQ